MAPYTRDEIEAMLADLESDLVEPKESLQGDNPGRIRQAVCARQMPAEYASNVLGIDASASAADPASDEHCIATVKHYRSLVPLAQDARKPIFSLSAGDGALGSHAAAARAAFGDFRTLVEDILQRTQAASAVRR